MSLNTKYRPNSFEEVIGQSVTVTILNKMIETGKIRNCLAFVGESGCGKTTCARIFANKINSGFCAPIEIDAASNNGVDQVRAIVEDAEQRALVGEYKVFIIDEAHMLTTAAWNAFLKTIEEPPKFTIFIFCTTEPNKIPQTIMNRVQRYNFAKISAEDIKTRLLYICNNEQYTNYTDACDFISKISLGGMRSAITYLEQCADYSTDLSIENVKHVLGDFSYEQMIKLTNYLIEGDQANVLALIDKLAFDGRDLKNFIDNYLEFLINVNKYILFKNITLTAIPQYLETINDNSLNIKYLVSIENNLAWFNALAEAVLSIKAAIKNDTSYKATISVMLLKICRGA